MYENFVGPIIILLLAAVYDYLVYPRLIKMQEKAKIKQKYKRKDSIFINPQKLIMEFNDK